MQSLQDIGVRQECLKLFQNYITNRQQCVKVGDVYSDKLTVEYGIPQGTVLGPILFSIYINDLFSLTDRGDIIGFADDTAIFYKAKTWEELKTLVENDLRNIKNWFDHKLLTVNIDKTNYIPFSCNKISQPSFETIDIEFEGNTYSILPEMKVKYLGLFIDKHLKWDLHITYVIKKLQMILHKFRYLCDILNKNNLKTIYHALVESHLNYGILAWGATTNNHIKPLEILQKRFIKLMLKEQKTYSTELVYNDAKVFDIRQLFYYNSNINYHRKKQYIVNPHEHNTRKKGRFVTPFMTKTIGQRSYVFLAPRLYNTIPDIAKINNIFSFKRRLKAFITTIPRETIHKYIDTKNC